MEYLPYTPEDLEVIIIGLKATIAILIPVAIGLLAFLLGTDIIPTILNKFKCGDIYDSDGLMLGEWEDYYNEDGSRKY